MKFLLILARIFRINIFITEISIKRANIDWTMMNIFSGMLDLALLTANAAQLKRILTIGPTHRFYHLLLTLISISICLQVRMNFSSLYLFNCRIFFIHYSLMISHLFCIVGCTGSSHVHFSYSLRCYQRRTASENCNN